MVETHMGTRDPDIADVARSLKIDLSPSDEVALDESAVQRVAEYISGHPELFKQDPASWDNPKFWNSESKPAARSQLITIGNTINFRFWKIDEGEFRAAGGTIRGEYFRGSMYMWRCLRLAFDRPGVPLLDAAYLENLSRDQFDEIFRDDSGQNPLDVAAEERLENLHDLGSRLGAEWGGEFYNVVQESGGSLVRFVELSRAFRAFDDPVAKLIMVNAIMHVGSGVASFDHPPLPGIDYHLLKQLLRQGILRPSSALARKIADRVLLEPGESVALRRTALRAFVEISSRTGVGGDILDNAWWFNKSRCRDRDPVCLDVAQERECPFLESCSRLTRLGLPLEETRYY